MWRSEIKLPAPAYNQTSEYLVKMFTSQGKDSRDVSSPLCISPADELMTPHSWKDPETVTDAQNKKHTIITIAGIAARSQNVTDY